MHILFVLAAAALLSITVHPSKRGWEIYPGETNDRDNKPKK